MKIISKETGSDGTIKYIFECKDSTRIEACLLLFGRDEVNICVSSQVGCAEHCIFCIAGHKRFVRNLAIDEIVQEAELIIEDAYDVINDKRIEFTYMGSGEPLDNFHSVVESADIITGSVRNVDRVNISTILPRIEFDDAILYKTKCKFHMQYSLHATRDDMRKQLFRKSLPPITQSLKRIGEVSGSMNDQFCVNYILFKNVNDTLINAHELINLISKYNCYVKISEYAEIEETALKPSTQAELFIDILAENNVMVKKFISHGRDVNAACGNFYRNCVL